jgi:hypothetical protein
MVSLVPSRPIRPIPGAQLTCLVLAAPPSDYGMVNLDNQTNFSHAWDCGIGRHANFNVVAATVGMLALLTSCAAARNGPNLGSAPFTKLVRMAHASVIARGRLTTLSPAQNWLRKARWSE